MNGLPWEGRPEEIEDDPLTQIIERIIESLDYPTGTLLVPIIYFEVQGVTDPEEMAMLLHRDNRFLYLFPEGTPTQEQIERFQLDFSKEIAYCVQEFNFITGRGHPEDRPRILAELVMDVVREKHYSSQSLLGPVLYCSLESIHTSDAIEHFLRKDPTFRFLFPSEIPTAYVIQQFREEHLSLIQECLETLRSRLGPGYELR